MRNSRQTGQETPDQDERDTIDTKTQVRSNTISENESTLLQNFRSKVDNIECKVCPTCNERIPAMTIIKSTGISRRCHTEKSSEKKFSAENYMDPGEVPDELQGLTEIEEMLIAQVFTVMSVYRLCGRQHGYHGNVINFLQDVHEFTKRLPRIPSSIDILIVCRHSADEPTVFRDFVV